MVCLEREEENRGCGEMASANLVVLIYRLGLDIDWEYPQGKYRRMDVLDMDAG